jgi:hypothetical protein
VTLWQDFSTPWRIFTLCKVYYIQMPQIVVTLALGSRSRQGLEKVRAKSEPGSHISCSQECKRMGENEPPVWEVGVQMDSWIFKGQLQGSASNVISIGGLHAKLWAPKVVGVPTLGILGLPLGSPRTKCHLDVGPMARHRIHYKGESGGFPQVWAVVNLVNLCLPVVRPCTKKGSSYVLTNLLFGLYKSVQVSDLLINLPSPILELQHAPLPSKCCEPGNTPQLLLL